jgi:hypothetical protein
MYSVNMFSKMLRSPWRDLRNRGDLDNAKTLYVTLGPHNAKTLCVTLGPLSPKLRYPERNHATPCDSKLTQTNLRKDIFLKP